MSVSERIRRLSRLVPFPALLLAAACGGGDSARRAEAHDGDIVRRVRQRHPAQAPLLSVAASAKRISRCASFNRAEGGAEMPQ